MNLAPCLPRLLPALLLALPLAASAAVFKWTDQNGKTVFSNQPPANPSKVSNVQTVVEDDAKPAAQPEPQKDVQDRIRALEQQVQALQSQAQAAAYPSYPVQMADYSSTPYYPSAYPPPPDYGYPYPYGYPYYPYGVVVVRPGHRFIGHRVGVRPMPVPHSVPMTQAVTRAMGFSRR